MAARPGVTAQTVPHVQTDPNATRDVYVPTALFPAGSRPGDIIAVRPSRTVVAKGKQRDHPLLFRVDKLGDTDSTAPSTDANAGTAGLAAPAIPVAAAARRTRDDAVVVRSTFEQHFPWINGHVNGRPSVSMELIRAPPPARYVASHVELYFANVYLGRPDQFRLSLNLVSTVLHLGQSVQAGGARLRVGGLFNQHDKKVRSAYVNDDTRFVFRSESARCFVCVEVAREMWHFEEDGSTLREKCEVFLTELFSHFYDYPPPTSHTVSIILYGRVIYEDNGEGELARAPLQRTSEGVLYRDFYKVLLDLTPSPPRSMARTVSAEIRNWESDVLLRTLESGQKSLAGRIAYAHESNVLEATNLALNSFEEHWIDRDLQRTGLSLLVLTAGTSFYQVDKSLLRITTERMLFHGVGLDIISLSKAPLHTAPLFVFRSPEPGLSEDVSSRYQPSTGLFSPSQSLRSKNSFPKSSHKFSSRSPTQQPFVPVGTASFPSDQRDPLYYDPPATATNLETSEYYSEPLFVFCTFFGFQTDKPHRLDRFMPRARCYELFSQGIGERIPVAIPLLEGVTMPASTASPTSSLGATRGIRDEAGWSGAFLGIEEQRHARRERHDALAVGVKRDRLRGDLAAGWDDRRSGASGASSSGLGPFFGDSSHDDRAGARVDGESESADRGAQVRDVPVPLGADAGAELIVARRKRTASTTDKRRQRNADRIVSTPAVSSGTTSTSGRGESDSTSSGTERSGTATATERGRARAISESVRRTMAASAASSVGRAGARSKTPRAGERHRSPSIASVRTATTSTTTTTTRAKTPALIARLTPNASVQSPSTNSGPTTTAAAPNARSGWLGLFRPGPVTSTAPAPSVAVQRVDAFSDLQGAASDASNLSRRATSPSSLARLSSSVASKPTQPIKINPRSGQMRDAERAAAAGKTSAAVGSAPRLSKKASMPPGQSQRSRGARSFGSKFNPSMPGTKRSVGLADQARRWASIFLRHANDQRAVNWVSITRGACLPITTDYLPTLETLTKQYREQEYSIPATSTGGSSLLRADDPKRSPVLELVTELISQRLSQGFQICTPANALGALDEINIASSKTVPDVLRDIHAGDVTAVYLSLADQIHRLHYDRLTQRVQVKISERVSTWKREGMQYSGLIWTQGSPNYSHTDFLFPFPVMITSKEWQRLDRLVAGVDQVPDLTAIPRFWRTRLVLLPADSVPNRDSVVAKPMFDPNEITTDDDIHYQGFLTLMNLLSGLRWAPPGLERDFPEVQTTKKTAPEWAAEIAREILKAEAATAPTGVAQFKARWLNLNAHWENSPSESSVPFANSIQAVRNVLERPRTPSPTRATDGAAVPTPMRRPTVKMAHSVFLDLDPQRKSDRAERVTCHFDRSHNSSAAYHIELTWLAGSGKIIDSAIQAWMRAVSRWGLNLVEVSTRPVESRHNPFQQAMRVPLAAPPPILHSDSSQHKHYYEDAFLKSLDFFLDVGADDTFPPEVDVEYSYRRAPTERSQYIHRSGTVQVCILGGADGFAYMPNRIFVSHSRAQIDPGLHIAALRQACGDEDRLNAFWVNALNGLTPSP